MGNNHTGCYMSQTFTAYNAVSEQEFKNEWINTSGLHIFWAGPYSVLMSEAFKSPIAEEIIDFFNLGADFHKVPFAKWQKNARDWCTCRSGTVSMGLHKHKIWHDIGEKYQRGLRLGWVQFYRQHLTRRQDFMTLNIRVNWEKIEDTSKLLPICLK